MTRNNLSPRAVAELLASVEQEGDGVSWLTSHIERTLADRPSAFRVVSTNSPERDEWSVEVTVGSATVASVDVRVFDANSNQSVMADYLDALIAKAVSCWRAVTQTGSVGEMRPWLGCAVIADGTAAGTVESAVGRLDALVRERLLDCVCVVVIDRNSRAVSHPSPVTSLDGLLASLEGRRAQWEAMFGRAI